MGAEWMIIRLGDTCKKIGSGSTPRGGKESYKTSGIALIRSQNVYTDGFRSNGLAFIDNEQADRLRHVIVEKEDVLLNITGEAVCRVCQVPDDVLPARVNQHVVIVRPDKTLLDAGFLRYFLSSQKMQAHMEGLSSAGATRRALTKTMIEGFKILAPSLPEQRRIAAVLGALDDKIALNRKMNETLEATAQAIFQSWFIDFDGVPPEELVESELGLIPKGWEVKRLGELCSNFTDGSHWSPKASTERSSLRIATVKDMGDSSLRWEAMKRVSASDHQKLLRDGCMAQRGDILFSKDGTIGRVIHYLDNAELGLLSSIAILRPTGEDVGVFLWGLMRRPETADVIRSGYVSGSALPRVILKDLKRLPLCFPDDETLHRYSQLVKPISHKIHYANAESRTLTALRDTLLPKLISGEVRVPEAKAQVEAVG